eukprot:gene817-863_t
MPYSGACQPYASASAVKFFPRASPPSSNRSVSQSKLLDAEPTGTKSGRRESSVRSTVSTVKMPSAHTPRYSRSTCGRSTTEGSSATSSSGATFPLPLQLAASNSVRVLSPEGSTVPESEIELRLQQLAEKFEIVETDLDWNGEVTDMKFFVLRRRAGKNSDADGKFAGYLKYEEKHKPGLNFVMVHGLFIQTEFRRDFLATFLIRAFETTMQSRGIEQVQTTKIIPEHMRFWERHGYYTMPDEEGQKVWGYKVFWQQESKKAKKPVLP